MLSYNETLPERWWARRRDDRLHRLDLTLTVWDCPPLGDLPDVSEILDKVEHAVAWCSRPQASGEQRRAGEILTLAGKALEAAEGLENTALAVVNHHLRRALEQVEEAARLLPAPTGPTMPGPRPPAVGQPASTQPGRPFG
ncbi:hypothetical protein [Kitasatospora purpeofusca]|uniref:hypothetical protein n=1 Tax=Kitasatospora purpeofusca TaxID=67352 RepID=UPI00386B10AB|nr:hypothetical protein OIP63_39170 [Kitasatospora purpeofusca]